MRDRSEVWRSLLADASERCSVSTARDLNTVTRRIENEGDTFFTKVLPTFAKDLERSLEECVVPSRLFAGFGRNKSRVLVTPLSAEPYEVEVPGGLPKFLGGFMDIIFDSSWNVTEEEWVQAGSTARSSGLDDCNFFPPVLRTPRDAVEEERMADAIHCIRQLTLLFSKEEAMCSEDLVDIAVSSYVMTDKELELPFWTGE